MSTDETEWVEYHPAGNYPPLDRVPPATVLHDVLVETSGHERSYDVAVRSDWDQDFPDEDEPGAWFVVGAGGATNWVRTAELKRWALMRVPGSPDDRDCGGRRP